MTKEALEDFCDVIVKPVADGGEGSVEAIKELKECEFLVACDVDNPLYGQKGAAYVYAPQKGANGRMVKQLDDGLKHFAGLVKERWRANFTLLAKFIKLAYLSYLCRKCLSSASTNQPVI